MSGSKNNFEGLNVRSGVTVASQLYKATGNIERANGHASLALGDRAEAQLYLREIERGALSRYRRDLEAAHYLKQLQVMGVDLSILGPQANVGEQSPVEISNKMVEISNKIYSIDRRTYQVDQSAGQLRGVLIEDRVRRKQQGLPPAEPRFELHELGEAASNVQRGQLHSQIPILFFYEHQYNNYAPPGKKMGKGEGKEEWLGHLSANAYVAYVECHQSRDRMSALDNFSALRGAGLEELARQTLYKYSQFVRSDFMQSRQYMFESIRYAENTIRGVGGVGTRELHMKFWDAGVTSVRLTSPWYREDQVAVIKQHAEVQGVSERKEHFQSLLQGSRLSDYGLRPPVSELGRSTEHESARGSGGPSR
jgi:hypothetical protein